MEIFTETGAAAEVYERGTPPENMKSTAWYAGVTGAHDGYGRRLGRRGIKPGDHEQNEAWLRHGRDYVPQHSRQRQSARRWRSIADALSARRFEIILSIATPTCA
jgi:hypothetical protein